MTQQHFEDFCDRLSQENGRYLVRKTVPLPMRRILVLKTNNLEAAKLVCCEIDGNILDSQTAAVWTPNSGYFIPPDVDAVKHIQQAEQFAAMAL